MTSSSPLVGVPVQFAGFPTSGVPNEGYQVWIPLVVMVICAGLVVIARLATRISAGQVGADDYMIGVSMTFWLVASIFWALMVRAGYGVQYTLLSDPQKFAFCKWWFMGAIFWICTILTYKVSVLLLLRRIFIQSEFQKICWVAMFVTVGWGLGNLMGWIFQCMPVEAMWGMEPDPDNVHCIHQNMFWQSMVAWDVSSDLVILLLPQPMIWKLSLKIREKALLAGMFLLGCIVVVFSFLSCTAIVTKLDAAASDKGKYTMHLANIFQVLEAGFGIIGACLPIMRQPLRRLFPRLCGSSSRYGYYSDHERSPHHVMQDLSNGQKTGTQTVSVSGPDMFRSTPRQSDELGIIEDAGGESGTETDGRSEGYQGGIKKETAFVVHRL